MSFQVMCRLIAGFRLAPGDAVPFFLLAGSAGILPAQGTQSPVFSLEGYAASSQPGRGRSPRTKPRRCIARAPNAPEYLESRDQYVLPPVASKLASGEVWRQRSKAPDPEPRRGGSASSPGRKPRVGGSLVFKPRRGDSKPESPRFPRVTGAPPGLESCWLRPGAYGPC